MKYYAQIDRKTQYAVIAAGQLPSSIILLRNKNGSIALNRASFQMLGKPVTPVGRGTMAVKYKMPMEDILYLIRMSNEFSKMTQEVNQKLLPVIRVVLPLLALSFMLGNLKPPQKQR
jgi:hypothetical protein